MNHAEVLPIGGRDGDGKTTVGWEVAAQLRAAAVAHAIVEGDPELSKIVESNLTAVWANYRRIGYRWLIYPNTVSVLPSTTGMFQLTAGDTTVGERLASRELGSELEQTLKSSAGKARLLDEQVPADAARIATDHRRVNDIAREVVAATGWCQ